MITFKIKYKKFKRGRTKLKVHFCKIFSSVQQNHKESFTGDILFLTALLSRYPTHPLIFLTPASRGSRFTHRFVVIVTEPDTCLWCRMNLII